MYFKIESRYSLWTTREHKLFPLPDHTEEVDVGVVDCEIDESRTSAPVQPQMLFQVINDADRYGLAIAQVLYVAAPGVRGDLPPVRRPIQILLWVVSPPVGIYI